jgi:hypothetical protein
MKTVPIHFVRLDDLRVCHDGVEFKEAYAHLDEAQTRVQELNQKTGFNHSVETYQIPLDTIKEALRQIEMAI